MQISEYLIKRLNELGLDEVFGVPGDYNFNLIEAVEQNKNVNWIGCANELNSAYMADGYARLKGIAAVITTYGVGELSAINGIAGAYAESLPIVHIGGIAKRSWINNKRIFHHCMGDNYNVFKEIYERVTCYQTILTEDNAQEEIERALYHLVTYKKPVYIGIYDDLAILPIKITTGKFSARKSDKNNLENALKQIDKMLQCAKNPLILSEYPIARFDLISKMKEYLKKTNMKYCTMVMGKSSVDEDNPNFIGTYTGAISAPHTICEFNNADVILAFGILETDFNTGGYTALLDYNKIINIQADYVEIKGERYHNVLISDLLSGLIKNAKKVKNDVKMPDLDYMEIKADDTCLTQDFIYYAVQDFLEANDNLVTETGLCNFGSIQMKIKNGARAFSQALWGSIGWATPAAIGICFADKKRKTILLTGEGSHQMSANEIGTITRYNLSPIVVVINNCGYTIERLLTKNPMDKMNEIASWNYENFAHSVAMGVNVVSAKTKNEFKNALKNARKSDKFTYIVAYTDILDAPQFARSLASNVQPTH